MTENDILHYISNSYGVQINKTTSLQEFLRDSLDIVEFAMMLEEQYGVSWSSLDLSAEQTAAEVAIKIIELCEKHE